MAKMTGLGKGLDALFGAVPQEEQMAEKSCSSTGCTKESCAGCPSSQQGQQAVEEDLSSQLPKAAANFTIKTKPVPSNGTFTPNPGQMNAIRAQVERDC